MSFVFSLDANNLADPVPQLSARSEEEDLHTLLQKNPHLLPGSQISDGEDLRWLLIRSEMPVPGPATGSNQWSLDLLFADHHGIPTLVECKKYLNTQARREVVGQMLEYAANARHYWTKEHLRQAAEATHAADLASKLATLGSDEGIDADTYFAAVEENLRQGKIRMIFFLDQAPTELRSIVEFLTDQMKDAEVLIVEAKQYRLSDSSRIVVPSLFGYTEKARVQRNAVAAASRQGQKWTEDLFFQAAQQTSPQIAPALRKLHDFLKGSGAEIWWGKGAVDGSINVGLPRFSLTGRGPSFLSAYSSGGLIFNFGNIATVPEMKAFRIALHEALRWELKFDIPDEMVGRYPTVGTGQWVPKVDLLIAVLKRLLDGDYSSKALATSAEVAGSSF